MFSVLMFGNTPYPFNLYFRCNSFTRSCCLGFLYVWLCNVEIYFRILKYIGCTEGLASDNIVIVRFNIF